MNRARSPPRPSRDHRPEITTRLEKAMRKSLLALAGATAGLTTVLVPSAAHAAPVPAQSDGEIVVADSETPLAIEGTCGDVRDVYVTNNGRVAARAHWELTCSGGRIYMSGWVDDTLSDGRCAYVRAEFSDGTYLAKNCPADSPRTNFKYSGRGNIANGYLFTR